jgi:hypothetical protein
MLAITSSLLSPVYERMQKIRLQVDKMVQISRELMHVTRYETQGYPG